MEKAMKMFRIMLFSLMLSGCAGSAAQKPGPPPPPPPPDRSGTYTFTMQGYSNGTTSASLTFVVTIKQGQWVNGVNQLTLTNGTVFGLCKPPAQPFTITESEFTSFPNMPEKLIINGNFADIISPDFSTLSGTWIPESDLPVCGTGGTAGGNWSAVKQ